MCGIVGLFLKDKSLEPKLGELLSEMLVSLTDRGPDSAGIAIYGAGDGKRSKITIQSPDPERDFAGLAQELGTQLGDEIGMIVKSTHAVIEISSAKRDEARAAILSLRPGVRIMGAGEVIEIYKEVGLPEEVVERFGAGQMTGTHGIGHTRMATESAVTTMGAHPFSTGPDQCLVHNGSLSNHNNLRRELMREGMRFETENDTEVAPPTFLQDRARHESRRGAGRQPGRPRRLLHLRRRHQERLRRGARSDRLQAGGAGRDRPLRRFRLRIPGAGQFAGHRGRAGLGAGAGQQSISGSIEHARTFDLAKTALRDLNHALHAIKEGSNETAWEVLNPKGSHAVAAGLDAPITVDMRGSVGYYCGGMNSEAAITVHGSAGPGVGENMMSGTDRRERRRQPVCRRHRPRRPAGHRGQRLLALRHLDEGHRHRRARQYRPHVGLHGAIRQSGRAGRCRRRAGRLHLRSAGFSCAARSKSLGADCVEKEMRPEHLDAPERPSRAGRA